MASGIEDFFDERFAVFILVAEDVAGDFDQVGVEVTFVPFLEHGVHFIGAHAEAVFHEIVGFADQLHVAVLNTVVHHFDIMPGAIGAHPITAGSSILNFGGDSLENIFHIRPGCFGTAGHDGGASAGAFFSAGNAGADEMKAARFHIFGAAYAVFV